MNRVLRSLLFVPGSRPERFEKALKAGADLVCIDLEDAVLPADKNSARKAVVEFIKRYPAICIRINPVGSKFGEQDLAALAEVKPAAIMIAKCGSNHDVIAVEQALGKSNASLIPLIETLEGVENAFEIARSSDAVSNMMFGGADMSTELRCDFSYEPLLFVRSRLVFAAAKANVSLIDVPFIDIKNDAGLVEETKRVKALGFSAKAAIHPCQISSIHQAFTPTNDEVEYAKMVLNTVNSPEAGVVVVNGRMVDRPIILACQRTLDLAQAATNPK